jgi:hypothetical protein
MGVNFKVIAVLEWLRNGDEVKSHASGLSAK